MKLKVPERKRKDLQCKNVLRQEYNPYGVEMNRDSYSLTTTTKTTTVKEDKRNNSVKG